MQTEPMSTLVPDARQLQRMESFLEELNARIARLSIALGISLKHEGELERVISELQEQAELHTSHSTPDRRLITQRIELRGLLVMRYGVEQRFVNQVGVTATRHILVEAEEHLARVGFEPGADGIDLRRLFEES
jgi:hypothetical protein